MADATCLQNIDEVCQFLQKRMVPPDILANFRSQKVDGKVVALMQIEDIKKLGLSAIGDILSLKDFCTKAAFETMPKVAIDKRKERKKELLNILRKELPSSSSIDSKISRTSVKKSKTLGRPKKTSKSVQFGLKVKSVDSSEPQLIKSPLGDKNLIGLDIGRTDTYQTIKKAVCEAFFPDGKNELVGDTLDYSFDLINIRNQVISEELTTLDNYLACKKIPGVPRLYLLCSPMYEDEDILNTSMYATTTTTKVLEEQAGIKKANEEAVDGDIFENSLYLNNSTTPNSKLTEEQTGNKTEVLASPSGEIIFTYKQDNAKDLMSSNTIENYILLENNEFDALPQREDETETGFDNECTGFMQCYKDEPLSTTSLENCIEKTLIETIDVLDPVEILRHYQLNILNGCKLDEEDLSEERDTNSIFVSRFDLITTAEDELNLESFDILRKPLEVTFYGEIAQDYGGPRREFFTNILKCLVDENQNMFRKSGTHSYSILQNTPVNVKRFYFAGVVCALSMLQNGPMPDFIEVDQMDKLLYGIGMSKTEEQFQKGLNSLGIINMIVQKPILRHLLVPNQSKQSISHKRLLLLLKPVFAEEGSNQRLFEERSYKEFVSYIKEVSAGRRGNVTMENVLQFVTGSDREPVLGFSNEPSITFRDDLPCWMPTAHTCTCQLSLPKGKDLPTKNDLFHLYDLAFLNTFFGYA